MIATNNLQSSCLLGGAVCWQTCWTSSWVLLIHTLRHKAGQVTSSQHFTMFFCAISWAVELAGWVELLVSYSFFFYREVIEESSFFRFCGEMIENEFVEIFWISWIGVDSRVVAPQLQASSCCSCSCSSAPAKFWNINLDGNYKYHKARENFGTIWNWSDF